MAACQVVPLPPKPQFGHSLWHGVATVNFREAQGSTSTRTADVVSSASSRSSRSILSLEVTDEILWDARYCDTTCRLGFIFQRQHYEYLEPGTATCCHISMSRSAPSFFLTQLFESSRFTSSRHSGYQVTAQMQMRRHIIFAPQQDQHGDFSAE